MQGNVSLALAGQYAETPREKQIAAQKKLAITPFPFEQMEQKLRVMNNLSALAELRLESYFTINFASLPAQWQIGGYVQYRLSVNIYS